MDINDNDNVKNMKSNINFGQPIPKPGKGVPLPKELEALLQKCSKARYFEDIFNYTYELKNDPSWKKITDGNYFCKGYYILLGLKNKMHKFIENLETAEKYGVTAAAPKVIRKMYAENNNAVIITKIEDSLGKDLIPYESVEKDVPVANKKQLAEEMIRMLNEGNLYNPAVINNKKFWFVTPNEKKIIIDDWSELKRCNSEVEKQELIKKISQMCGLIYY